MHLICLCHILMVHRPEGPLSSLQFDTQHYLCFARNLFLKEQVSPLRVQAQSASLAQLPGLALHSQFLIRSGAGLASGTTPPRDRDENLLLRSCRQDPSRQASGSRPWARFEVPQSHFDLWVSNFWQDSWYSGSCAALFCFLSINQDNVVCCTTLK